LQPINKVVLLQMKKSSGGSDDFFAIGFPLPTNLIGKSSVLRSYAGSSDDFSAGDFPLPTNIIGKSSVLPWQQEDCGQTTFLPQPTAH